MSKRARELIRNGTGPKEKILSSGVTVTVLPFPVGLFQELNIKAMQEYPDPVPPKKKIQALGGEEEIDDLKDPDYLAQAQAVNSQRSALLGEAIVDFCVQVDLEPYQNEIRRLEKYRGPLPEDPDDRRIAFLTGYALRTRADYESVTIDAITDMMIEDPEVAEKLKYFQHQVERAAAPGDASPGAAQG